MTNANHESIEQPMFSWEERVPALKTLSDFDQLVARWREVLSARVARWVGDRTTANSEKIDQARFELAQRLKLRRNQERLLRLMESS